METERKKQKLNVLNIGDISNEKATFPFSSFLVRLGGFDLFFKVF